MNNRGFTMVELLGAIVILGILSITSIVSVQRLIEKSHKEEMRSLKRTLSEAAESYALAHQSIRPREIGKTRSITAKVLKEARYLKEDLKNYRDESCMENSYVDIKKTAKSNYEYKAYLYCGDEKPVEEEAKDKPHITATFEDGSGNEHTNSFSNVVDGKLIITILGSQTDDTVGVDSYSYSISAKTEDDPNLHEVYNSGNINAYKQKKIVKEHMLKEYLNVSQNTDFHIRVKAINTLGVEGIYDTNSSFKDVTPPMCQLLSEPIAENDWLNKKDIAKGKTRVISVSCNDGSGSGCISPNYTKTWPNDSQKNHEFGYIKLQDNAKNEYNCKVRVNIDQKAPKIEVISPVKKKIVANDKHDGVTVKADAYNNLVNGWMNGTNYNGGATFTIKLSDNIGLASYSWTTNGSREENQSGNLSGKEQTINVKLIDEGLNRSAKLVVKDKANNSTTINILANIDRTGPTIFIVNNDIYYYSLTATASDSLSLVNKVKWDNDNYTNVGSVGHYSFSVSGVTAGYRFAYAVDNAGNVSSGQTRAYKQFDRLLTNWDSRAYRIDDTIDSKCAKDADYSEQYKNHPWKRYGMDYYDCQCSYDYYNGAYYTYHTNQRRTGYEGHWSRFMVIFYQNSDNGVSACKGGAGNNPKNSYIYDLCVDGTYPPNIAQKSFHGYIWYNGAVPAGGYSSWHKKAWYHDNGDRNNQAPYGSTVGTACIHSCQIAGINGVYAQG